MSDRTSGSSPRFHALDSLRAAAMLLGVLYHAIVFGMFLGGIEAFLHPKPGQRWTMEWMHSFRMPLFFLISGFFGAMMLEKYGIRTFFLRRWSRIGVPMMTAILTLVPLTTIAMIATFSPPKPAGNPAQSVTKDKDGQESTSVKSKTGSTKEQANQPAKDSLKGEDQVKSKESTKDSNVDAFSPPGRPTIASRIIGEIAGLFALSFLWFLWYLLLFITLFAAAAWVQSKAFPSLSFAVFEPKGLWIIRTGLAPLILGLISTPALVLAPSPFGWSLGTPAAASLPFPDFALHLDAESGFYLLYFLAGWWLYSVKEGLPALARAWIPNLLIGTIVFTIGTELSQTYFSQTKIAHYGLIRWASYLTYCVGAAFTAFGFLGLFERYLNRPTRVGRYLADTAFWVYVVHLSIVVPLLPVLRPLHLPWWLSGLVNASLSTAIALLLFKWVVRPTFLVRLFGPAGYHQPHPKTVPAEPGEPEDLQPSEQPEAQLR